MNGITCNTEISDIIAAEVDAETGTTAASDALAAIRADSHVCPWAMATKWVHLGRVKVGSLDEHTPWMHDSYQRNVFFEVMDNSRYCWVRVEYRRYGRAGKIRTSTYRGILHLSPDEHSNRWWWNSAPDDAE